MVERRVPFLCSRPHSRRVQTPPFLCIPDALRAFPAFTCALTPGSYSTVDNEEELREFWRQQQGGRGGSARRQEPRRRTQVGR